MAFHRPRCNKALEPNNNPRLFLRTFAVVRNARPLLAFCPSGRRRGLGCKCQIPLIFASKSSVVSGLLACVRIAPSPSGSARWLRNFRNRRTNRRPAPCLPGDSRSTRPLADLGAKTKAGIFAGFCFGSMPVMSGAPSERFVDLNDRKILRRQRQGGRIHRGRAALWFSDARHTSDPEIAIAPRAIKKGGCENELLHGELRDVD